MIWATVSFWSCFCWLYRASPSLAAKNIISLISVLTIWWYPCVESSLVLLEKGLLWPGHSLGKTLLAFVLLHFLLQGQICLLLHVSHDFLLLHSNPIQRKGHPFWVLVLGGLICLHRTVQLQLLQHYWLGHRLRLLWYRMVCLGNEQRSFCCFWDCIQVLLFRLFCDYDGHSISSKGFLLTVADTMVISVKFIHSIIYIYIYIYLVLPHHPYSLFTLTLRINLTHIY